MIQTNLLQLVTNPQHSVEGAFFTGAIAVISLLLFVFWNRKRALLNFQAWSLLISIINFIFFFHYFPVGPHVLVHTPGDIHALTQDIVDAEYQFTPFALFFLQFLEYMTSAVTIWKLWKLSEKYIPKELLHGGARKKSSDRKSGNKRLQKRLLVHSLAIWHTFKNGGNNVENDKNVRRSIKKAIKEV
jgi:hypothetical protein